ncbi:hypothetical protein JNUCC1_00295 [Lentibacillus sp. JNUCC-1]|uniref:hypothetical protein n=1 Tax=Lentibacillus sp. JNUCC-1 TaxID=2654513 RepID=UPI0012E8C453|nr:hypothetical protein [Lentibacillus sp. JNUCC-1]MUV36493.1 hypothetical protein [Lentibacillus sp. JNUCC-1]
MDLLEIYLLRNKKRRDHVVAETGISRDLLELADPDRPSYIPAEAVRAIAETVGKTPKMVQLDLKNLEREEGYKIVYDAPDLLSALEEKEPHIIIRGEFKDIFKETYQQPLSDTEQMGMDLGSGGFIRFFGDAFYRIFNLYDEDTKQKKDIESKVRKYTIRPLSEQELLLYLKQLEY